MTKDERRESKRISMKNRRDLNPDKFREYNRNYHHKSHAENKEKMRKYYAKRFFWAKAMKLKGEGRATYKDLASLWRKQRGLCAITGRRLERTAEPDHIIPKAKGGNDSKLNLRWVCKEVNRMKRDMLDAEFISLCADVMQLLGERIQMVENITKQLSEAA
jgi:5-methylcytosine-specific restriction endonuclease McrA